MRRRRFHRRTCWWIMCGCTSGGSDGLPARDRRADARLVQVWRPVPTLKPDLQAELKFAWNVALGGDLAEGRARDRSVGRGELRSVEQVVALRAELDVQFP